MADTYTPSLRIAQQTIGGNENSWGTILNSEVAMLEEAVAGISSVSVTAGNVTLSTANNTTDQARPALLILTGTPGVARTVTLPDVKKVTFVFNNSDSNVTLSAGAGTFVALVPGTKEPVFTDGATNVASLTFGPTTSWTPTLIGGTVAGTQTYVQQTGQCKVFGNLVWIWAYVEISAKDGAASGDATIGGLPFTVQASRRYGLTSAIWRRITYVGQLSFAAIEGTQTIKMIQNPSGGDSSFVQMSGIDGLTNITITGWYKRS